MSDEDLLDVSFLDDESSDAPVKGDLVWATTSSTTTMWPGLVTSVYRDQTVMVRVLGKPGNKAPVKTTKVELYTADSLHEKEAQKDKYWESAKIEINKILDKNSEGILETKLVTPGTPSSRSGKRRKTENINCSGFSVGDIVWGKYRRHPTWPAKVVDIDSRFAWLDYIQCEGAVIRTEISKVSHFDCPGYAGYVDSGINSPMSVAFKRAYKEAHEMFVKDHGSDRVPLIHLNFNNGVHATIEEPVSPRMGRNQLVFFIEKKGMKIISDILKGRLKSNYLKKAPVVGSSPLFGGFAKTQLQEQRIIDAVQTLQYKLAKDHKDLSPTFSLDVILPECVIRLIMEKQKLTYIKALEKYENSTSKLTKKEREEARTGLLQPLSEERKADLTETSALIQEQLRLQLLSRPSPKRKRTR